MALFSQDFMDTYYVDDDDSSEGESSSEDEINVILHGTPKQKQRLKMLQKKPDKLSSQGDGDQLSSSSSEDEFEKEMNAELNQQISNMENERGSIQNEEEMPSSSMSKLNVSSTKSNKDEHYSEVYFDSDEEDSSGKKSQHSVLSNDDLLYDPTMDDKDQKWVDRQRQKHSIGRPGQRNGKKPMPKPSSDALLDCPACLTTVCIDCQRHETYKNQYRAMFVMNCSVDTSEKLQCPEQPSKKKKKPQSKTDTPVPAVMENSSSDLFNPVRCTECNTVVAVIDEDEVYHFFDVIASYT